MLGWIDDIERVTLNNTTFRTVLFTGEHTQLTVMRLGPGEDIGREVHSHLDQFIRIEEGQARVELGRTEASMKHSSVFGAAHRAWRGRIASGRRTASAAS